MNTGNVVELAEQHAQELRDSLGLGPGPIADIFTLIELDLGVRLYQRRLSSKSKVSGLFAYDEAVGACILLNANHPWERRVQSAAHELGHFVGTRQSPEVLEVDEKFLSREERYANAFGRAFLTPRKSFSESFRHLTEGASRLTRRHVVLLAHQFNVSREACVRRLEELDLVRKGTWEWFVANGGISSDVVKSVLGEMAERDDPAKEDANRPVSQRLALRAYEAWSRDLMSEGQLAELLKVPRVALRKLLDQIEMEESETDDFLKLSR
ncbi:MAG: ImmA/IrrE family metallo-endopeptidase [Thalassospira sp.]|nr:ImmA/IrrE family metallo-endopeptidase [Thalassospira sp.]MBO6841206.1 ImmA/IrrE family metallo-endopeptidase [Thalassospira sp.]